MNMTSRERVTCAINFQTPDRVPFNFWMDRRRMQELDERFGHDFRLTHFGADVVEVAVPIPFPCGQFEMRSGTGWMVAPAFEDWGQARQLPMPDPDDPALYQGVTAALQQHKDRAVIVNLPNVLTMIESMRRQEDLYMDMMMQPEAVAELFGRMSDVMAAAARRVCQMDITALYVMDDVAFNGGLLIGQQQFEELVLPSWKKVIDQAHEAGKPVFFHTDGKIDAIWDVFADPLGVRMLNPLQPNLQSIPDFKARYHGRMGVYGGLETGIIHSMTPQQVTEHVRRLFEQCGQGGGLIMSSHDIDYTIPLETLEAMVAAIKDCRY